MSVDQLSMFDIHEAYAPPLTDFQALYALASSCTQWLEDDKIIAAIKIDQLNAFDVSDEADSDVQTISSVCSLNTTKAGASLFFFGAKFASIVKKKKTGALRLEIPQKYLPAKPSWCDDYSVHRRVTNEKEEFFTWSEGIHPNKDLTEYLRDIKLLFFRKIAVDACGCCNDFVACSDARACLKPHSTVSIKCYYRENLENGLIFYGKNMNFFFSGTEGRS